jgi:hypothetical protein
MGQGSSKSSGCASPWALTCLRGAYEKSIQIMERFSFLAFLFAFFSVGCAHSPSPVSSLSSASYFQPRWVMVVYDPGHDLLKSPTVLVASPPHSPEASKSSVMVPKNPAPPATISPGLSRPVMHIT